MDSAVSFTLQVQPTCSDIGGQQHMNRAAFEVDERLLSHWLGQLPVQLADSHLFHDREAGV